MEFSARTVVVYGSGTIAVLLQHGFFRLTAYGTLRGLPAAFCPYGLAAPGTSTLAGGDAPRSAPVFLFHTGTDIPREAIPFILGSGSRNTDKKVKGGANE